MLVLMAYVARFASGNLAVTNRSYQPTRAGDDDREIVKSQRFEQEDVLLRTTWLAPRFLSSVRTPHAYHSRIVQLSILYKLTRRNNESAENDFVKH